jgi:hypothetical protein
MIEIQRDESPGKIDRIAADRQASTTASTRRSTSGISYRAFGEDFGVEPDLT